MEPTRPSVCPIMSPEARGSFGALATLDKEDGYGNVQVLPPDNLLGTTDDRGRVPVRVARRDDTYVPRARASLVLGNADLFVIPATDSLPLGDWNEAAGAAAATRE